jgi:xanthine dehydrogenase accessory factor
MNSIVHTACELLEQGETFVVATIVSQEGSTPRAAGTKMIVTAQGDIIGTIGGGSMEADAVSRSVELIADDCSAVMSFDLGREISADMDMICGGETEVLLDRVEPTQENIFLFGKWRRILDQREKGCLATIAQKMDGLLVRTTHCLITGRMEILGDCPLDEPAREIVLNTAKIAKGVRGIDVSDTFVMVEPAIRICTAFFFGAGHVAEPTVHIAAMTGFYVVVADDREAFAGRQRFPEAHEIRVLENFEKAYDDLTIDSNAFIVIFTRDHFNDGILLEQALKTEATYIGMIGSRRKVEAVFDRLRKEGFSKEDLDRVHSPIGLDIGAETPEEIAVSIVAEMIQQRATRFL